MPYPNGQPTYDESIGRANQFLKGALTAPVEPDSGTDVVCALVGIGHALLAVADKLDSLVETTGQR